MKVSTPIKENSGFSALPKTDPHMDASKVPRFSSPLSFLSKKAFLFAILLLSPQQTEATPNCVCNYDSSKDYFPVKLQPNYAQQYGIEYFKTYKKLTVKKAGVPVQEFYAYLCGTPKPSEATEANGIQIPIDTSVVTTTTFLPYLEYLGQRQSLRYVSTNSAGMDQCLVKLYEDGLVADSDNSADSSISMQEKFSEINATSFKLTKETLDVAFISSLTSTLPARLNSFFGNHTKSVFINQNGETELLAQLEWIEFVAALYNLEDHAQNVISRIEARYNCARDKVLQELPLVRKKVFWGSCYYSGGKWSCSVATCPNYYCKLVQDAGGDLISVTGKYSGLNITQFVALAKDADVCVYLDGNFLDSTIYSSHIFFNENNATLSTLKCVQDKQIYDIIGDHLLNYFDRSKAEPDVFLMDLIEAFYPGIYLPNYLKDFIRNVFTEPAASQAPRLASQCVDVNAVLYTGWLSGACSEVSVGTTDKVSPPLCSKTSSGLLVVPQFTLLLAVVLFVILA